MYYCSICDSTSVQHAVHLKTPQHVNSRRVKLEELKSTDAADLKREHNLSLIHI